MLGLLIDHVREVHGEATLGNAHHEAVGEAVDVHPVERRDAVAPFLDSVMPFRPTRFEACSARVVGPDLEARRVDETIQLVLLASDHGALLCHPLDTRALRIDERDVGAIEGLEVLVVEARPLAELAVVGLEGFRGRPVFDDGVLLAPGSAPSS